MLAKKKKQTNLLPYTVSESNTRKELGLPTTGGLSSNELRHVKNSMLRQQQAIDAGNKPLMASDLWAELAASKKESGVNNGVGVNNNSGGGGLSAIDRYTQQLQRILTGGGYEKPYNDLQSQLETLYGQATPKINDAMSGLQTFLQGQANPYAGFQAQQTEVTPQLSELLASQGVSQNPLQQLAATTQAQNAGQATAFNNLVGTLGQLYGANQQSAIQGAQQQQADLLSQLEQSRLGMGSQIAEKKMGQQQDLMKMLLTALSKGGKPKKGRLF